MKRLLKLFAMLGIAAAFAFAFAACDDAPADNEITLGYGQETAYFNASVALRPISGAIPGENDRVERAAVRITANQPAVMRLTIDLTGDPVDGLMIQTEGYEAVAVTDGAVVYTSPPPEKDKVLNVVGYFKIDAGEAAAGKTVAFDFVLESEEA